MDKITWIRKQLQKWEEEYSNCSPNQNIQNEGAKQYLYEWNRQIETDRLETAYIRYAKKIKAEKHEQSHHKPFEGLWAIV